MKNVIEIVSGVSNDPYKTADTVNAAGGKAWEMSNDTRLEQLCMTGTMGSTFYATQREVVMGAMDVLNSAKPSKIAECVVKGRNEGYVRTFNIMGLVELSKKDTYLFKKVFNDVIKTGNDLKDFIDLIRKTRGFGRSIKSALHGWIAKRTNEYYALKYRNEIADAIRLSRFKGADPIFKFILGHYEGSVVKGRDGDERIMLDSKDVKSALKKYPKLKASEKVLELLDGDEKDLLKATKLIDEFELDIETLMGKASKFTPEVWDAIASQSPTMRFLKYLNKFDKEGVLGRNPGLVAEKLTVERLQKAKVFPFRLYTAYSHMTNRDAANTLADVLDQYVGIYDWGVFDKYSWLIAPDVSGSMSNPIPRGDGKMSDQSYCTIAGLFSGFFYKGLKNSQVLAWSDNVKGYVAPKRDSVITHIRNLTQSSGGGTHMELPVLALIEKKIKIDRLLLITDSEEWGTGWLKAWREYRKRINPKAMAFMLRLDPHNTQAFDDASALKDGIRQIFGWSENVISYIEWQCENDK